MKIKILSLIFLSFGIFAYGFPVSAATIFADNFNDYSNGSINGQGGWSGNPAFFVTQNSVLEGEKALFAYSPISPTTATKSGTLLNDGQITIYVYRFDANQQGAFWLTLKEGENTKIEVRGNFGVNGKFQYVNGSTAAYTDFGPWFNYEAWYAVQIQWRSSDHSVRYNIDDGVWTDWVPALTPWVTGLDALGLEVVNSIVFDVIQEKPIAPEKTPVLIIPGVTSTEFKNGNKLLWADLSAMLLSFDDSILDELEFNSNLVSNIGNISTSGVISSKNLGPFSFDYTEGLIAELQNQGYLENETLFTFPYDWRYGMTGKYPDNKTNTDLLAEKINQILAQTNAEKVDVIAHSMGGLIVKEYAVNHVNNNHIGKAVFVGVPNTGAPKSVKTLLEGDNLGMFFVSDQEIKKISQNMPAIYDLLPSLQYYNTKGSYVKVVDPGFTGLNPTVKDLTYEETKTFYTSDNQLNALAVNNADNLHAQSFDNFDLRSAGIDLYAIDGCKVGTIGKIVQVKSKNIFGQTIIDYKKPETVPGDGTVPLESATNLPIDSIKKYYALTGKHGTMLSQDGTRQQIVNIVSGSNLAIGGGILTQNINDCELDGKAISVYSPVDISVTDQYGNKLGLADDRSIFNEIPNASFEIMGEHKFLYLPTDNGQTYDINIKGTDAGTYTITSQTITGSEIIDTEVFSNLPATNQLSGSINLGSQTSLTVQETPSSPIQTILPDTTLNAEQSEDVLAPISTTTMDGKIFQSGSYAGEFKKDVVVKINAFDSTANGPASGILSLQYQIDNGGFKKAVGQNTNFIISGRGDHTIQWFATDKAGNNEAVKTVMFTVKSPK